MEVWVFGAAANLAVASAYLAIGVTVLRGVHRTRQWQSNPLAVATGLIFLTCAAGHGVHLEHLFIGEETAAATRLSFDWHLVVVDLATACVGVWYWLQRHRLPALVQTTGLFEDLEIRRKHALDLQDNIVQQFAAAKMAVELGQTDQARDILTRGLTSSQSMVMELLDDEMSDATLSPGGLRRRDRAGVA